LLSPVLALLVVPHGAFGVYENIFNAKGEEAGEEIRESI